MGELLDEVTTNESITTYTRSYAGGFENPYNGAPSLTFHMHRVTIRNADDTVIAAQSLPNVHEPYVPNKTYALYNPSTGSKIPGQTVTSDMAYAVIYSMMMRAILDSRVAAAQVTLTIANNGVAVAQAAYDAAVVGGDQPTIDAELAALTAAQAAQTAAQAAYDAAVAEI
jgi:hypothetical protein